MDIAQLYALISVIAVSLISLIGIIGLSMRESFLRKNLFLLVSLAVGALFGDVFIHLLPHAHEELPGKVAVPFFVLLGIVIFFVLEKFLRWQHVHGVHETDDQADTTKPVGPLVLIGDAVHNFIDGIIIGGSFLVNIEVGFATTLAIALHEIPQEIGDFALLIHAGYSKRRALLLNFLSGLIAIIGTVGVFVFASVEGIIPALAALAAGGFIYIAGSDLVPELHKNGKVGQSFQQLIAILVGIGLMFALLLFE